MSAGEHARDARPSRAPNATPSTGPRAPVPDSMLVSLQRTLGNRAVGRLLQSRPPWGRPTAVQRNGGKDGDGAVGDQQMQVQVQSPAMHPNFEREVVQLERAAGDAANRLMLLIEDARAAETRGERLTIDALRTALVTTFGQIR